MGSDPRSASWQLGLVLLIAVIAVSTAAPLARLAMNTTGLQTVGFSLVLAASRLTIAALILLPHWRSLHHCPCPPAAFGYAIVAGLTLAVHFATWITSLAFTSVAASTAIVTTNPIWIALLSWLWFKETLTGKRLIGIIIALAGGLLIGLGGLNPTPSGHPALIGNGLALIGAWTVSLYFLLGREAQRQGLTIRSYIVVAYSVAAIVLLPLPLLTHTQYTHYPPAVYGYTLLTALIPQLIGHTSLNWLVHRMSPTIVSVVLLFEPVLSSLFAFFLFREIPDNTVIVGAVVILIGVTIAI